MASKTKSKTTPPSEEIEVKIIKSSLRPSIRKFLVSGAMSVTFPKDSHPGLAKVKKAESKGLGDGALFRIQPRIGKETIRFAEGEIKKFISDLARMIETSVQHNRQQTVTVLAIEQAINVPFGACVFPGSVNAVKYCEGLQVSPKDAVSKIPFVVIKRELHEIWEEPLRVAKDAKLCIVHLVETYIRLIGTRAILFAHSAKRETLKAEDISKALICIWNR